MQGATKQSKQDDTLANRTPIHILKWAINMWSGNKVLRVGADIAEKCRRKCRWNYKTRILTSQVSCSSSACSDCSSSSQTLTYLQRSDVIDVGSSSSVMLILRSLYVLPLIVPVLIVLITMPESTWSPTGKTVGLLGDGGMHDMKSVWANEWVKLCGWWDDDKRAVGIATGAVDEVIVAVDAVERSAVMGKRKLG